MDISAVAEIFRGAILQILLVSSPLLLAGLVVGLVMGIIQAATTIQDPTLATVPKIIAVFVVFALFAPWMISNLVYFSQQIMSYWQVVAKL